MEHSQLEIDEMWLYIRTNRNELLSQSDWTQILDNQLSEVKRSEWTSYRQSLRDITLQQDPFNLTWPNRPE